MIFTYDEYLDLHTLFDEDYAGYRPEVQEAPNGDGRVDTGKRYLHVSPKYGPPAWAMNYLARAHYHACAYAERVGVPDAFYPKVEDGTLRVLYYPEGQGSAEHTDMDLFTVNCFRSVPVPGWPEVHIGELGELVGLGPAMVHSVPGSVSYQCSIVYFALSSMSAVLPMGETVLEWLQERKKRSRV